MQELRANTQVIVTVGPFLDVGDGFTPQTDITLGGNEAELLKHGSTTVVDISSATWAAVTNCRGYYSLTLTTSHINTEGMLVVIVQDDSDCLPVKQEYMVLSQAAWDSKYAAKDAGFMDVNVKAISEDSAAADNLEATFDSTGYVDDDAPATQAQLGQISLTGAAVSTPAKDSPNGFSIAFGENEANNEDSTHEVDGTYHDIEAQDDGGTEKIDVYYEFDVGGDGVPTSVSWEGYLTSGGGQPKNITVQAYNWTTWDQIGSVSSGGSNVSETFSLFTSHVGTGANLGLVRIKFVTGSVAFTATTTLKTDRIFLSYAIVRRSVGYANGAIWVDTSASNTNTENYVDGTADNPVSTWAAALTLSSQMNIDQFHIANGSTITLSAASDGYTMFGDNWTLALNSKSIAGSHFQGASVSGIATGATAPDFHDCRFGAVTLPPCKLYSCGIGVSDGLFTGGTAGDYLFLYCFSVVAGSGTPDFDFTGAGAAVGINNRAWTGGASYTLDSDCTMSHEVLAGGGTTVTTGGASVEIRGITSSVTLVLSGAGTVQFVGITGPVTISGTATTTVNLYGHATSLADSSSGTTVNDLTVQLDSSGYTKISDGTGIGQVDLSSGLVSLHGDYNPAKTAAQAGDAMALTSGAVDAVWDENINSAHQTANTAGKRLDDASTTIATNLNAAVGDVEADTQNIQSRLPASLIGGRIDADVEAINNVTAAADQLAKSAAIIVSGTVDDTVAPTTTVFEAADVTEATADHFNGRVVIFTSGVLQDQATTIEDYELNGGRGKFTVVAMTEPPADSDTFVIV